MMELLAPAGDFKSARSAVANGADAVYVGGTVLNARRAAAGFSGEELKQLVAYCHLRKVKVFVTVNTLTREDELPQLTQLAREIAESGADAAIVSDLGTARILHALCPTLPLHASTQMNIHTLEGVLFLERSGFKRVVLARELSLREIKTICRRTKMEIEVFAHGALCMCYSGNCYLSAVIGQKSGNRGLCAQPCRLPYQEGLYPLSLKDLCTLPLLDKLNEAGVTSLKIEGRLKSPEYVGSVTAAYRKALNGEAVTPEDTVRLAHIFSRDGFTHDYLSERPSPAMFGTKTKTSYADYKEAVSSVVKTLEEDYETKKRTVDFHLVMREGLCKLKVRCEDFEKEIIGPPPQDALRREVTAEDAVKSLSKLGGTPFAMGECKATVHHDLFYPAAAFNALRRQALEDVAAHFLPQPHPFKDHLPPLSAPMKAPKPQLEGWFWEPANAPQDLSGLSRYWLNALKYEACLPFKEDPKAGLFFPPVIEDEDLEKMANRLYVHGFRRALCRNPGQFALLRRMGYEVHADFSLNVANAHTLEVLKPLVSSATLSFELTLRQLRHIPKTMPTGMIVYGRLPLMETRNCIIKNCAPCQKGKGYTLTDRTGRGFPIACGHECRNTLFNSTPLYLADRNREWQECGVAFGRMLFTFESPQEIQGLISAYQKGARETPEDYTRGLYYRGVL